MDEPWRLPAEVMCRVQHEKTWSSGQRGCILRPCQGQNGNPGCYATENRQQAVKRVALRSDLLLVVGSQNSSNSRRLVEVGENLGARGYLIDDEIDLDARWFEGVKTVTVTAGASAPESLVQRVIHHLSRFGFARVEEVEVIEEDVRFSLPPQLAPYEGELTQIANLC